MVYLVLKVGAESKGVMDDNIAKQVDILVFKNQVLQILYLKHHDNLYKTS